MSWAHSVIGRAGALASRIRADFENVGGCHPGAESDAKNKAGEIAETIVTSLADPNTVVKISGSGSAWKEGDTYKSQSFKLEIETVYNFVE